MNKKLIAAKMTEKEKDHPGLAEAMRVIADLGFSLATKKDEQGDHYLALRKLYKEKYKGKESVIFTTFDYPRLNLKEEYADNVVRTQSDILRDMMLITNARRMIIFYSDELSQPRTWDLRIAKYSRTPVIIYVKDETQEKEINTMGADVRFVHTSEELERELNKLQDDHVHQTC